MDLSRQFISRVKNQVSRIIDGEAVIILRKKKKRERIDRQIIILTANATRIWELLDHGLKVSDLLREVSGKFNLDYRQYRDEFIKFISQLRKEGLVSVSMVKKHK